MLRRFCLYGFLKNQQYFEPFLILAFRQKGLSFAMIGLLIGFREICINLMEIPTGAIADVLGRRRAMIGSFLAYIIAFAIFGMASQLWLLFVGMLLFATGEAFRTGTHKAIIFDWLWRQGRQSEKTSIYGRTRSWSKLGSAVSVLIAAGMIFMTEDFSTIFLFCIIPYSLNIFNFLSYPSYLDGAVDRPGGMRAVVQKLLSAVGASLRRRSLRRLLAESMAFEGLYRAGKDYLQPVLKSAALAAPILLTMSDHRRIALLVGAVYFPLYLLSSLASRGAGGFVRRIGGQRRGARMLWLLDVATFAMMGAGILAGLTSVVIASFVALAVLQNIWRPMLISRIASCADQSETATVLSIESQARSLFVAILAPLLGWAVDAISTSRPDLRFLPIAGIGVVVALIMLITSRKKNG